eukprot:8587033-Lingulodinium_polyedra.AAC.1
MDVAVDCFALIASLRSGREACVGQDKVGAHIWEQVWRHLDDMGPWQVWVEGQRPPLEEVPLAIRW